MSYLVYVSCHSRVQWGRNKCDRPTFQRWISGAYKQNGFALGAYHSTKLIAFMLPHCVGRIAVMSYIASHSDFLKYRPNDGLYHGLLCVARQTPGVASVDFVALCAKESLNQFKLSFGTLHEYPAYTWINPLIRPVAWHRIRTRYPWLSLNTQLGGY